MAYLRKRGKCYSAYVVKKVGGKKVTYETFNFGRIKKDEAKTRLSRINKAEWKIINGEITPDDYPTWFEWLNDKGIYEELRVRTLGETIEEFLIDKEDEIRSSSLDRVRISMDRLLDVFPPKTKLKDIDTKGNIFAKKFKKHSEKSKKEGGFGHRPAGINVNLRNIKTFLRWCYDMEYMDRIPKVVINEVIQEPKYLNEKEIIKVLKACTPFYRSVFRIYLETSKRRSELIKGHLRGNLLIIGIEEGLKGRKNTHSIKLNDRQLKVITELHRQKEEYLAKGYLLRSFLDYFTKYFTRKLKAEGVYEKWRTKLHSLRHSQAVMTYLESSDVKSVMDKLNHSRMETSLLYSECDQNIMEIDFPTTYEVSKIAEKVQKSTMADTFDGQLRQLD